MTKHYCDRCGKETSSLERICIPDKKTGKTSFSVKEFEVCKDCKNASENIVEKLIGIRFLLFADFMEKKDIGEE